MKKLLAIFIVLLVICSAFVLPVYATEASSETNIVVVESNVYSDGDTNDAWVPDGMSIIVTLLVSGVTAIALIISHNSANKQVSATTYMAKNGYNVKRNQKQFIKTYNTTERNFYGSNKN